MTPKWVWNPQNFCAHYNYPTLLFFSAENPEYDLDCVYGGTHVHIHISTTAEFVIYCDACHLKNYACNPVRRNKTQTAQKLASLSTVVDWFHFAGHVDPSLVPGEL